MPGDLPSRVELVVLAAAVEGGLGLLACILGWLFDQPPLASFSWSIKAALDGLVASLPMLALFYACIHWPWAPLARIKHFSEEVVRPLFTPCSVSDLALISLLAGVGEEMFFRGFLQGSLSGRLGPVSGLALASLLFGLVHAITPAYVLLAALMGAYLGWFWRIEGNLLAMMVAHTIYDLAALLYLVRMMPRRADAGSAPISAQVPEDPPSASLPGP